MSNRDALSKYLVEPRNGRFRPNDPAVYEFPIDGLDRNTFEQLDPRESNANFFADPQAAWAGRLKSGSIPSKAERELIQAWSKYTPVALVWSEREIWWKCTPGGDCMHDDYFLLGAHRTGVGLGERLTLAGFAIAQELAQLCDLMTGYREDHPPWGGLVPDWKVANLILTDAELWPDFGEFRLGEHWDPSLTLFQALDGDVLLVNREGACGWWEDGSDEGVMPFAESLDECISRWVGHWFIAHAKAAERGTGHCPFDAHGIP